MSQLDDNIKNLLINKNKYILPIIYQDKLINYYFYSNNKLLNKIKDQFYYDKEINDAYLISFDIIKNNIKFKNIHLFLQDFFEEEKNITKEEFDYNVVNSFFEILYELSNEKYKELKEYFNVFDKSIKSDLAYNTLFYYCYIASSNNLILDQEQKINFLNKLT